MSKGNIIIVEDEFIISDDLSATLEECGYTVVGVAENVDEFLALIRGNEVDLILLDINLNQPVDGVQIAHIINTEYKKPFVFVTAFTDSATIERVKHTNPYGYVSKPYNDIDLMITVELALSKFKSKTAASTKVDSGSKSVETLFIKTKKGLEKINIADIRWIEAYDYYSYIRLEEEKILATVTLKELEKKVEGTSFVKVHRKYSINFNHLEKVIGNQVEIAGELIPVSRIHKEELLKKLNLL
ncbi:MAG: two-component system response regulator LytT [Crocinitomicaceae bacterium]|jgi:two-component system response regulator LytT